MFPWSHVNWKIETCNSLNKGYCVLLTIVGYVVFFRVMLLIYWIIVFSLIHQAAELEIEAYLLLDELTSTISTLNLERVRRLKSRLVALTRRVQKVI